MGRLKKGNSRIFEKCINCQQVKIEHQNSSGLLQEIQVPTSKLEDIIMDFVVELPRTQKQHDSIWMVADRLTKFTYFIPVKSTYSAEDYARIFIAEILCHDGIPLSIISYRGTNSHLCF